MYQFLLLIRNKQDIHVAEYCLMLQIWKHTCTRHLQPETISMYMGIREKLVLRLSCEGTKRGIPTRDQVSQCEDTFPLKNHICRYLPYISKIFLKGRSTMFNKWLGPISNAESWGWNITDTAKPQNNQSRMYTNANREKACWSAAESFSAVYYMKFTYLIVHCLHWISSIRSVLIAYQQ